MTEIKMKKLLLIFLVASCLLACKKDQPIEVVVVSVYSLPIKGANYNEPKKNYYHIAQFDNECWVLVRSWVVSDFVENKFEKRSYPTEVYNSTFETRFEIPKSLIK